MTAVPGGTGPRRSWGILALVVGYLLLAPKTFFLGPLALLLLLSRPTRLQEWLWIGVALAAAAVMVRIPATLTDRTIRGAGMLFTGTFVMMSLLGIRSLFHRTLLATALAAACTAAWFRMLGIGWRQLTDAVAEYSWALWRAQMPSLPEVPPEGMAIAADASAKLAADLAMAMRAAADLFPALLALSAMAGGWLAWAWYHRVASHPIGRPPAAWRTFRFSDHLIWLVIVAGALVLFGVGGPVGPLVRNLLVIGLALYAGRGVAVIQTALVPAPMAMGVLLTLVAVLLLPLAGAVCVLTGIADTWLDLRRRMVPPEGAS